MTHHMLKCARYCWMVWPPLPISRLSGSFQYPEPFTYPAAFECDDVIRRARISRPPHRGLSLMGCFVSPLKV